MTAWAEFLRKSDAEMRRNEMNRGLAFSPDPGASTLDLVTCYCDGFAWNGVGAKEVIQQTHRAPMSVRRALKTLVDAGVLRMEETPTRGPKASPRKVYFKVGDTHPRTEAYNGELESD